MNTTQTAAHLSPRSLPVRPPRPSLKSPISRSSPRTPSVRKSAVPAQVTSIGPTQEFRATLVALIPRMHARARSLGANATNANDLVQETCRRALEAHAQFLSGTNFAGWLFRILRNAFYDQKRRAARETPLGDASDYVAADQPSDKPIWTTISDEALTLAIASLSDVYRTTYTLYECEHFSYQQIADRLGIPVNTVSTRIARARKYLCRSLKANSA